MNIINLEVTKKEYIRLLISFICLMIILIGVYYFSLIVYSPFELEESTVTEIDPTINVHIDVLEYDNSKIVVSGWAYKENEEIRTINSNYILKNQETNEMYKLRTRHVQNENIPEVYQVAGMSSRAVLYGLKNGRYDICVLYKNNDNDILVNTGIYIDIVK